MRPVGIVFSIIFLSGPILNAQDSKEISDQEMVWLEQRLLQKLSSLEDAAFRKLKSSAASKDFNVTTVKPYYNSLRASLLGGPFKSASSGPSLVVRGEETPESLSAAYNLLSELSHLKDSFNFEGIQIWSRVSGINRAEVFKLLVARVQEEIASGRAFGNHGQSLMSLLESFQNEMLILEPAKIANLYADLYRATTRIGNVEASRIRMESIQRDVRIPTAANDAVKVVIAENIVLIPSKDRPQGWDYLFPDTFEAQAPASPVKTLSPAQQEARSRHLVANWQSQFSPTQTEKELLKALREAIGFVQIKNPKAFAVAQPYIQGVVAQLDRSHLRDPFFSQSGAVILGIDQSASIPAGAFLAKVLDEFSERRPSLKDAFEYLQSQSGLDRAKAEEFLWKLIPVLYQNPAVITRSPEGGAALRENLGVLSRLTTGLANLDISNAQDYEKTSEFLSATIGVFLRGFDEVEHVHLGSNQNLADLQREYLKTAPVNPFLIVAFRNELINALGDRMEKIGYSSFASLPTEAAQREAIVKEQMKMVDLMLTPLSGEKEVTIETQMKILEQLAQGLQASGTEINFDEIQRLKAIFRNASPQVFKDLEKEIELAMLRSNIEVARASRSTYEKNRVAAYSSLVSDGREARMLRAQIPTVHDGTDLAFQFNRVLPRSPAQISAGMTNYEPNHERARGYTPSDAHYHMHLVQLWYERAKEISENFESSSSHGNLHAILTLKKIISEFPKNKPGAPTIETLGDIQRYHQAHQFPKDFEQTLRTQVLKLIRQMIYNDVALTHSVDEVLEALQSTDYRELSIKNIVTPEDYVKIRREIMMEILPSLMKRSPTGGQLAEYLWVYARGQYQPRLTPDSPTHLVPNDPSQFSSADVVGAMNFQWANKTLSRPQETAEERLSIVMNEADKMLAAKYPPYEGRTVDAAAVSAMAKEVLNHLARGGVSVDSMTSQKLARMKELSQGTLTVRDVNGGMMVVPTFPQKIANVMDAARRFVDGVSLEFWNRVRFKDPTLGLQSICRRKVAGLRGSD